VRLRFLVDTGAVYTVLPRSVWSRLRLRPHRTVEFTLADGGVIARPVSACWIEVEGTSAPSPVVLGEADDGPLLGAVTLSFNTFMVERVRHIIFPELLAWLPWVLLGVEAYLVGGFVRDRLLGRGISKDIDALVDELVGGLGFLDRQRPVASEDHQAGDRRVHATCAQRKGVDVAEHLGNGLAGDKTELLRARGMAGNDAAQVLTLVDETEVTADVGGVDFLIVKSAAMEESDLGIALRHDQHMGVEVAERRWKEHFRAIQLDLANLTSWNATNTSIRPTLPSGDIWSLYIADFRTFNATNQSGVRLTNGITLPPGGRVMPLVRRTPD